MRFSSAITPPVSAQDANSFVRTNLRDGKPTEEAYSEWQKAFQWFNERLFDSELPDCLITLPRKWGVYGYFRPDSFENLSGAAAHEIAINPSLVKIFGDVEALQTVVHEMTHLWRHVFGPKNRKGGRSSRGYHDLVWADKMTSIGLEPSHTGKPGGRRTGNQMMDYTIPGGPFDLACRELLISGFSISWRDHAVNPRNDVSGAENNGAEGEDSTRPQIKTSDRKRFSCPQCGLNAWAKPSAQLVCGICNIPMSTPERGSRSIIRSENS